MIVFVLGLFNSFLSFFSALICCFVNLPVLPLAKLNNASAHFKPSSSFTTSTFCFLFGDCFSESFLATTGNAALVTIVLVITFLSGDGFVVIVIILLPIFLLIVTRLDLAPKLFKIICCPETLPKDEAGIVIAFKVEPRLE